LRPILDAVFYVLKSGCPWRWLPKDFPPWKTVYDWFRRWRIDGTWERLNAELRELLRARLGRDPKPSAAIVDSQSVRTTGVGGNERGFDPAKGVEGRKRHLLVDTEGLVLQARVHRAPGCPTKTASGCCWSRCALASRAFLTCGWTPATREGAGVGQRRLWT
jgi:putative transposase